MNFRITQEPAIEPITLAEAKAYLRVTGNAEDALITGLIAAARATCEKHTNRAFITQTWELVLDQFPCGPKGGPGDWWDGVREVAISTVYGEKRFIDLPVCPLISLESLTTYDVDDAAAVFDISNLVVSRDRTPGRIALKTGAVWPIATRGADAIKIVWKAGYGDTADTVPAPIRQAMKLLISHFFEFRQPVELAKAGGALEMPWSVDALLGPYVVRRI